MLVIQQNYGSVKCNLSPKNNLQNNTNAVSFGLTPGAAKKIIYRSDLKPKSKNLLLTLINDKVKLKKANYSTEAIAKFAGIRNNLISKISYRLYEIRGKVTIPRDFKLPEELILELEAQRNFTMQNRDWFTAENFIHNLDFNVGSSLMRPKKGEVKHFFLENKFTQKLLKDAINGVKMNEELVESAL